MRSSSLALRLLGTVAASVCGCLGAAAIASPLTPGHMIFFEFFDDWHTLNPEKGQFAELEEWNPYFGGTTTSHTMTFDHDGALLYGSGGSIFRLNPFTGRVTELRRLLGPQSPFGFVLEDSGDFLVGDGHIGISRFSRTTRELTTLLPISPTFMPRDLVEGIDGRAFVLEARSHILELDLASATTRLVTSFESPQASIEAVHPNGDLLVRSFTFLDQELNLVEQLHLVDPDTGEQTLFSNDLPPVADFFAFDSNGRLWATSFLGLFRFESSGGAATLIHEEAFFNPEQIALVPLDWAPTTPEPASAILGAMAAGVVLRWRRTLRP